MTPFERFSQDFQGKKVLVLGLGLLGGATKTSLTLLKAGCTLRVSDLKDEVLLKPSVDMLKGHSVEFVFGPHRQQDVDWADCILRNPSVPWHHEILEYARTRQKDIIMDAQLFVEYCGIKTVGITGTRGKSTTTLMTHAILKSGFNGTVYLGGNLAQQPLLPLLEEISDTNASIAVLELSSWQLQAFATKKISVNFACVTNLYPDHLNYYSNLEEYYHDKKHIFAYQGHSDHVCFLKSQVQFHEWANLAPGIVHWYDESSLPTNVKLIIPGVHNRLNAAAAFTLATSLGIPESVSIDSLNAFEGVPYRLQTIAIKNGVTYINDTTATTPVAATIALNTLTSPMIVIAGGHDKNVPLEDFAQALNEKAKAIILLQGSGTSRLLSLLDTKKIILQTGNFATAVAKAASVATTGDSVLLSPGFASFGMFANEFDRGQQFNALVEAL